MHLIMPPDSMSNLIKSTLHYDTVEKMHTFSFAEGNSKYKPASNYCIKKACPCDRLILKIENV